MRTLSNKRNARAVLPGHLTILVAVRPAGIFHVRFIRGGLSFLQKCLESYQVVVHCLAWVYAKELRDRMPGYTCWRQVVHLDSHARAAVAVLIEADKPGAANL